MLIMGAGGHALEILELAAQNGQLEELCFFDNTRSAPSWVYDRFPVLYQEEQLRAHFTQTPDFVLGVGNPKVRRILAQIGQAAGGQFQSIQAQDVYIGQFDNQLAQGLNLMQGVWISNSVSIEEGALINAGAQLHHEVKVGAYTEISPKALLLGAVQIGQNCRIGAQATVLPGIKIADEVVVGAGAVVHKDLPKGVTAVGVPAKIIKGPAVF